MPLVSSNNTHTIPSAKHQAGVSLLEVLLAVVILSIGFLASARMQIEGMKANQNALFISQANFMLRDMTDRMRANTAGLSLGAYDGKTTESVTTEPACINAETPCNPLQITQGDLYSWHAKLYATAGSQNFIPALPSIDAVSARGSIILDPGTNTYTLSMFWAEADDAGVITEQRLRVFFTP